MRTIVLTEAQHEALLTVLHRATEAAAQGPNGGNAQAWLETLCVLEATAEQSSKAFHAGVVAIVQHFAEIAPEDQAETLMQATGYDARRAGAVWLDIGEAFGYDDSSESGA